jgi:hypothetical protein
VDPNPLIPIDWDDVTFNASGATATGLGIYAPRTSVMFFPASDTTFYLTDTNGIPIPENTNGFATLVRTYNVVAGFACTDSLFQINHPSFNPGGHWSGELLLDSSPPKITVQNNFGNSAFMMTFYYNNVYLRTYSWYVA